MTTPNLISRERAKLNLPSAVAGDDRTIDALIGAVSSAIQKHCRRTFALQRYDEVLDGTPQDVLILKEYPLQAVESVRHSPYTVLTVQNTSTTTNQQARVAVTSTGLELTRVASGVMTRDTTVTFAANLTIAALAAAVVALGASWTATATTDYTLFPSQDLWIPRGGPSSGDANQSMGALDCRGRDAPLSLHMVELADYAWSASGWLYQPKGTTLDWFDAVPRKYWTGPQGHWRVQYHAGYQEIPEDVQEAAAQWVAILHYQTTRDPRLIQESSAPASGTATFKGYGEPAGPPAIVGALLSPYRRRIV